MSLAPKLWDAPPPDEQSNLWFWAGLSLIFLPPLALWGIVTFKINIELNTISFLLLAAPFVAIILINTQSTRKFGWSMLTASILTILLIFAMCGQTGKNLAN